MSARRRILAFAALALGMSFAGLPALASVDRVVLAEDFTASW